MPRKKAIRIKQANNLPNIIRSPKIYKGSWRKAFFGNKNPIILELACGKGEYAIQLSKLFPDKNFIGIDRKADRLWHGASAAIEKNLSNVAFINGNIEFIEDYFKKNEVDEIWITFPDPYLKKPNRRLTSNIFLEKYKKILRPDGIVHLKTDEPRLYVSTLSMLNTNNCNVLEESENLYSSHLKAEPAMQIVTNYEQKHISDGDAIFYIEFTL